MQIAISIGVPRKIQFVTSTTLVCDLKPAQLAFASGWPETAMCRWHLERGEETRDNPSDGVWNVLHVSQTFLACNSLLSSV